MWASFGSYWGLLSLGLIDRVKYFDDIFMLKKNTWENLMADLWHIRHKTLKLEVFPDNFHNAANYIWRIPVMDQYTDELVKLAGLVSFSHQQGSFDKVQVNEDPWSLREALQADIFVNR